MSYLDDYSTIPVDVIRDYAKDAGVLLDCGRVAILNGFHLWYTVDINDIKNRVVDGSRFWRMVTDGASRTSSGNAFAGLPVPSAIAAKLVRHKDLRDFAFVALRRLAAHFPGCRLRLVNAKNVGQFE